MTAALQQPAGKNNPPQNGLMALGLVFELGYLIAIPAFAFGFGGAYLDKWAGTSPLFLLLGLALALCVSGLAVYRSVMRVMHSS